MGAAMASLAIACIAVGLAAGPVSAAIGVVADGLVGHGSTSAAAIEPATVGVPVVGIDAVYAAGRLAVLLGGIAGLTWLVAVRRRTTRRVPTWTTGIAPDPTFEYTATSYAKLIRLYFGPVLRPAREVSVELHPGTPFPRTIRYRGEVRHVLDERLYGPLHRGAVGAAQLVRRLQSGSLQLYLAYSVAALIGLLLVARS
jgi:hydrogenase-4 component B